MKIISKKPNIYYLAFVFFALLVYIFFDRTNQLSWVALFALAFIGTFILPFGIFAKPSWRFLIFTYPNKSVRNILRLTLIVGFISAILIIYFIVPEVSERNNFLILFLSLILGTVLGTIREWRNYKKFGV